MGHPVVHQVPMLLQNHVHVPIRVQVAVLNKADGVIQVIILVVVSYPNQYLKRLNSEL